MKKVTLSAVVAIFAIGAAFAGSATQAGHFLWNPATQSFDKTTLPPSQVLIDQRCVGSETDCYYIQNETGDKEVIALRAL
ncbi:DUF6520 family protein [Chitinophaga niabensis]|uniref:Uncharacterized protein n=1 Tax=Chitinophaga niabensis TaxID=536979 RepID=A0A1N6D537_9BACT|nr:DUF6520 family protein [Chitinophaga niabensis]SIN65827.1 hypothetical protein SAMN04488055_0273 [Chitinophaga niabensis]